MKSNHPKPVEDALKRGVVARLPITFLPFVNQQLDQWDYLFQNERKSVERLLLYVSRLSDAECTRLFRNVVELEEKMGVRHWKFSTTEQTIENSSMLAKSPYFQEWREAVQVVFDVSDRSDVDSTARKSGNRLILISIPAALPVRPHEVWNRWKSAGKSFSIRRASGRAGKGMAESFLADAGSGKFIEQGIPISPVPIIDRENSSDEWVVDAGHSLVLAALGAHRDSVQLSYPRLDAYRQNFSHEMNTMRKDLADADAVFDRLRKVDVSPWCPAEIADKPSVREFVRSLYLSGNGAVIFGNSFVEWAASEALRRARPTLLVAEFGMRAKPKPFTGVAVFENPEMVNPLPAMDDPEGSALDAEILAAYIWLAATRYEEYRHSTVGVCVAESLNQCYLIAPPEFSMPASDGVVEETELTAALCAWIA